MSESASILPLASKKAGLHAGPISAKTVVPSPFIKPFYISAIAASSPPFLLHILPSPFQQYQCSSQNEAITSLTVLILGLTQRC